MVVRKPPLTPAVVRALDVVIGFAQADMAMAEGDGDPGRRADAAELARGLEYLRKLLRWYHAAGR